MMAGLGLPHARDGRIISAMKHGFAIVAAAGVLAACQPGGGAGVPDAETQQQLAQIGVSDVVHFVGTEPFWGGQIKGGSLTYTTPENQTGTTIAVERFAGLGGFSYSGTLDAASLDMMVTLGECSDGMSDRTYPFTVTLKIGGETRQGCAWTDTMRFEGPEQP